MDKEEATEWKKLVRMNEHDRVSQASSVVTISSFPVKDGSHKVQNFGKRGRAVKRDPNCTVVIRGWLYKQDSSGLKLWKRRWFVLSDYCLFYYKDSREESVLGSIPLPSYKILFCTSRECKNRKYTFKAVHQGMRSYFFSADTQEDMLGWVRALSQSASMDFEGCLNRRCSSFQDFTQMGGSCESLEHSQMPALRNGPVHSAAPQNESSRIGTPQMEKRVRQKNFRPSSSPRTSTPMSSGGQRRRGQSLTQEPNELNSNQTPPPMLKSSGSRPLTPRSQLGSRPHTPVGRVDIRPHDDLLLVHQNLGSTPPSPKMDYESNLVLPAGEKRHLYNKSNSSVSSPHHIPVVRRVAGKTCSYGGQAGLLPPLPPPRATPTTPTSHHHQHHRNAVSVCLLQPPMPASSELYHERDIYRPLESDVDAMLTRLCGCDKLLQSLSVQLAQLQVEKDHVHCALEMNRLQLEEWKAQGNRGLSGKAQEAANQTALLQEELVNIRARMCEVSMEMERVWSQYERMESELLVQRSQLQHICRFGRPQEQSLCQRELWMMEDILCGLSSNKSHFRAILGLQRQRVLQKSPLLPDDHASEADRLQSGTTMEMETEPPPRPPLPQELHMTNQSSWMHSETELEVLNSDLSPDGEGNRLSVLPWEGKHSPTATVPFSGFNASNLPASDATIKRARMSEGEQKVRMRRNRLSSQKQASTNHLQGQTTPNEEVPFPLRVTRVITGVLPSSRIARRVSVEDPPPELAAPFPELSAELKEEAAERSTSEKPNAHTPHKGWLASGSVLGQADEATVELRSSFGNRQGEKEGVRVPLMTSDPDLNMYLTPEQREAKLKRVERIRERVIKSAARESSSYSIPYSSGGSTERFTLTLENEASKICKQVPGYPRISDCQISDGPDCRSNRYKDQSPVSQRHRSKIPSIQNNKRRDNLAKGFKQSGQVDISDDSLSADSITHQTKGVSKKDLQTANHVSRLTVHPSSRLQSTQKAYDTQQPNVFQLKPKGTEKPLTTNNERLSLSTSKRAEWFLSVDEGVDKDKPSVNHRMESVQIRGDIEKDSDLSWATSSYVDSDIMEYFSSPTKQSLQYPQEEHREPDEGTPTHSTANSSSVACDNQTTCTSISEIHKPDGSKDEGTEGSILSSVCDDTVDEALMILYQQVASGGRWQEQNNSRVQDCYPNDLGCSISGTPTELTPSYATIHFPPPPSSDDEQHSEEIIDSRLAKGIRAYQNASQDVCHAVSTLLAKSTKDIHIYEEIACETQPSEQQDAPLSVSEASTSQSGTVSCSVPVHSVSSTETYETDVLTENKMSNGPPVSKSPNEVQTDPSTNEDTMGFVLEGKAVQFRNDGANNSSVFKVGTDNQGYLFPKARVTVVRTSL